MSAARTAICAVSGSRISPTMMMSGSWRRMERRQREKSKPISLFTCTCWIPGWRYSTGSSTVMMFLRGDLIALIAVCSVVDLPLPVGPVRSTIPHGRLIARRKHSSCSGSKPEVLERVVLDDGLLLEEPQDDLLAVDRRQRRHAKVDLAIVDVGGEAAVLGEPALRDVEPRDDLEPRDHRQVKRARDLEQVEEQAVDRGSARASGPRRLRRGCPRRCRRRPGSARSSRP